MRPIRSIARDTVSVAVTVRWYARPEDPIFLGWRLLRRGPSLESRAQIKEIAMATLHIQHLVTDFDTWTAAFDRFADARRGAESARSGSSAQ